MKQLFSGDHPHHRRSACGRRGLRSQSFDAEGVKVKKIALIDEGVLTTWLLDSATARELGMTTTGHAHRGGVFLAADRRGTTCISKRAR